MTITKICGLTTVEDAVFTALAGADFIGLVFAEGRRQVDMHTAAEITKSVHALKTGTNMAGVFVNLPAEEVNRTANMCGLDRVQISGDETWEYCLNIAYPLIKVIHITAAKTAEQVIDELERGSQLMANRNWIFMLDTGTGGKYGGTGAAFDWDIAAEVSKHFPLIIAGGLNPGNVTDAIRRINPIGVDVSTGVETDKRKDRTKIKAFIEAAGAGHAARESCAQDKTRGENI